MVPRVIRKYVSTWKVSLARYFRSNFVCASTSASLAVPKTCTAWVPGRSGHAIQPAVGSKWPAAQIRHWEHCYPARNRQAEQCTRKTTRVRSTRHHDRGFCSSCDGWIKPVGAGGPTATAAASYALCTASNQVALRHLWRVTCKTHLTALQALPLEKSTPEITITTPPPLQPSPRPPGQGP